MFKNYQKIFLAAVVLALLFNFSLAAGAGAGAAAVRNDAKTQLDTAGGSWGGEPQAGSTDLAGIVGLVVQAFLGLLGVIFLVLIIYAGYNWMTAQGEEEKVTKAKDTLQRAVIGLIITIGAYAISFWVLHKLLTGTNIIAP